MVWFTSFSVDTILQHIDLVIPRGSAALVKHVSENTKIPVMGHR